HDQGGEAEATAALDDLGDAVDRHHALDVVVLLCVIAAAAALTLAAVRTLGTFAPLTCGTGGACGTGSPTLRCSHHAFLCSLTYICALTGTGPLHGHPQRRRPRGRGRCCHHGRR